MIGARRYPNRLRALREHRGLSQQAAAGSAGISVAYYGALERGDKRINADTAERLSRALGCAAGDLLGKGRGVSVPVAYAVAAAKPGAPPIAYDLPEPRERVQLPRLASVENCYAAEIVDDSANLDFAPGTIVVARRVEPFSAIPVGAKVLARFFLSPAAGPDARGTHEILYGILDRNIVGDLVLITRTRNPSVPRHFLIQGAPPAPPDATPGSPALVSREALIDYAPRPGDPAELLGIAIYAMGPV